MVEILLASYNGGRFIGEQLDSILSQSYQNFRILVSDDGSTDETCRVLGQYKKENPDQLELVTFSHPSGSPQGNFFRLLSQAKEDYVMLCDQDDVWIPEKIRLTLDRMEQMENQYGSQTPLLVHGDLCVVDRQMRVIHPSMRAYQKIRPEHKELRHYLVENNITGNTVMINRALLDLVRTAPKVCCMHDWWLGLVAGSFGQISYLDLPLTLYRQHGGNQLGAEESGIVEEYKKRLASGDRVRENYRKMFAQAECFFDLYQDRLDQSQKELLRSFLEIPKLGRIGRMSRVIKLGLFKSTWIRTAGQMWSIG